MAARGKIVLAVFRNRRTEAPPPLVFHQRVPGSTFHVSGMWEAPQCADLFLERDLSGFVGGGVRTRK